MPYPTALPKKSTGTGPRYIYAALLAGLDPILIFAPQRKDSERIARQIAASLPEEDPLELSAEQRSLAGENLSKLLKSRVAYHHSGLSYKQRAGVIEPLAKAGQLRVVVATTGLGAGINFSMRSVIITERDYRQQDQVSQVRADELLQMFGRAGRRGLDDRGYVLVLPNKPRLEDAAPILLKRAPQIDWPSFLSFMYQSQQHGMDPKQTALKLAASLFSPAPLPLGLNSGHHLLESESLASAPKPRTHRDPSLQAADRDTVIEILNSEENWERRRGPHTVPIEQALTRHREKWKPAAQVAATLAPFPFGTTCKLHTPENQRIYGKEWIVAHFPTESDRHSLFLNKKYRKLLREALQANQRKTAPVPKRLGLDALESHLRTMLPIVTQGGTLHEMTERQGAIVARIDMRAVQVSVRKDSRGKYLCQPPERQVTSAYENFSLKDHSLAELPNRQITPADIWSQLGLIDSEGYPTRRGVIFSFFNHGEGLAVAAALEDKDYAIEQLVWDLANLRTGHRFDELGDIGSRLSYVCRETYGSVSHPGYLRRGLPEEYGEGGAELVFNTTKDAKWKYQIVGGEISTGDVERVILEWKSVLRQIVNAPEFPWDRWMELQYQIRENIHLVERNQNLLDLPSLTARQRSRKPIPFRPKK